MKIVRAARPEASFTIIRNDVLRDSRLSYRARGVLAFILSNVDDWRVTADSLADMGSEGRQAIHTVFKELRAAGYIEQRRKQDLETGRWETMTIVYDSPRNGSLDVPAKPKKASDEYLKTASKMVAEVWEPAVRGFSTQPAIAVVRIVATSLRNGVPASKLSKALTSIAAKKQTVTATRLSEEMNGRPLRGQLQADRTFDWKAETANSTDGVVAL